MRLSLPAATSVLLLAACSACAPGVPPAKATGLDLTSLAGSSWLAEDIDGRGVLDRLQSKLQFVSASQVAGNGGCNSFGGSVTIAGDTLVAGPLAATQMACSTAVMDQEARFFKALARARSARMENGLLYLRDESGADILRFARLD